MKELLKNYLFSPGGVLALFGVITLLYLRSRKRKRNIWKDAGNVPYIEALPFLGSLLDFTGKKLQHEVEIDRYEKYGSVYGYYEGPRPCLSVADPKLLRNIFVKDFQYFADRRTFRTGDPVAENMVQNLTGEDWKRVRTIITPTFTTAKIKRMMDIFVSCSKVLVNNLRGFAERKEPFDAKQLYSAFTMDIIASSAFSTKLDSHNDPNNVFVQKGRAVFGSGLNYRFLIYLVCPWLMKLFKIPVFPPEGVRFFSATTKQIIDERKRTGQKRNDFLQLLLDTAEEEQTEEQKNSFENKDDILSNYQSETNEQVFKTLPPSKKTLSFHELVAQCVIFFLAGFETTASTLSFAAYHLALNPDIQDRLREEINQAIRAGNGKLTYDAVQSMKYMDNVISETLRINPPAVRVERLALDDYNLGYRNLVIPKNSAVTIPLYAMHHDPKFYPDPEKFDPERFSPEAIAKREPYTYLPFGAGPRNCIGMRFALVEAKVCLAHVITNFTIKRCPQTKVPIEYKKSINLVQPKDITVVMETRDDCPLTN